ncbi:Ig-like domain-containing protein [Arthrobacter sp. NPDC090010]|uniref:Ig-like domain-containing protein n=1 Tax=Arthrobacter sp. NPDC090010 TaxID=3363942 RepID=UPI0038018754
MSRVRPFSSLGRKTRRAVAIASVTVVSLSLAAAALAYPGFKTAEVDLNDGGVWVTSKARNAVGRLNYASKVLDGAATPASSSFDVLQSKQTVLVRDSESGGLNQLDPSTVRLSGEEKAPAASSTLIGGGVVAVADPVKGRVWAMKSDAIGGFAPDSVEPSVVGGQGTLAAVGADGHVGVADPEKGVLTEFSLDDAGTVTDHKTQERSDLKGAGELQMAVLGDKTVVLDGARGKLLLPGGGSVTVPDARNAKLQQSGPASDQVAIATGTQLILQPLDGGQASTVDAGGTGVAAAPVQLGGCVYSAWSGSNRYVRKCTDPANDQQRDVPKASNTPSFVFRVNRDLVVLNDVNAGNVWLVNQNMLLVNNWDDVIPPKHTSQDADQESADEVQRTTLPDRTKPNTPPVVKPDSYGVRAGRTTVLPVLDNDSDADGDVLRVHADTQPAFGHVEGIYGATGFQISVPGDAKGNTQFKYTANDGRGGSNAAVVSLTVVPPEVNHKPQLKPGRVPSLTLMQGKQLVQNVLSDFMDPDGDDMYLVGASSSNDQDIVQTRPDGQLSLKDAGSVPGKRTVTLKISDGRETAEIPVTLDVRPSGALAPIANADSVVAMAGQSITIAPLKNDVDPLGGQLRLAQVTADGQSSATIGADQQTFQFSSRTEGPHYITYMVTNGPAAAQQLVRVDVVPANTGEAPIAVRDVAQLPSGGSALVDVLGNDFDPAGGVLVVQSVTVPNGAPVSVSVLDHSVVRVTDLHAQGTVTLKYTISNGKASATGEISVVVIPPPAKLAAPQAKDDEATVRVGDVVTIPVLANDVDPNGGKLTLSPKLTEVPDVADGRIFTSGNNVRFLAGNTPKTVYATYTVKNESGQEDSAQLVIRIKARDDARNSRPEPKNVTARVLAGMKTKIVIPLDGIDPDGDSVELVGIDKAPALGTAVVGDGSIDYIAGSASAGTDTFTYRVRDRIGAENTGTVIVGVAPAPTVNQKPIAVDDVAEVKPGRKVAVDALANDSDPDGDPISLVKDRFDAEAALQASATENGRVLLTAPDATGTHNVRYTIQDDKGAQGSAVIVLKVTPKHLPEAPVANDDHVSLSQTLGKTAVDVPVLKNDSDPDGVTEDLKITFPDGTPNAVVSAKGSVRVTLTSAPQLIPYTVTDMDGLSATAIIHVPGQGDMPPALKNSQVVEVTAGQSVDLKLSDYVAVRAGHSPRVTVADKIKVMGGASDKVIGSDGTSLHYAALKDFVGPGSITFEVTDGSGPDDPNGLTSTLTILTLVKPDPNANHPPTFLGSPLDVPMGETATLDLSKLAKDVDPGDQEKLKFTLENKPSRFEAKLDGSTLSVSAPKETPVDSTAKIGLSVTDGRSDPVSAEVTVQLVASDRAKPVANDDVVDKADAGKPSTTDVTANDVNPFPDTPLKVVDVQVETGSTAGAPTVNGGNVTVTPAADFKGVLVVRYSIEDKTGDPSRRATGRLRLTVRAAPDTPSAPTASDIRDRTAVLHWAPPSDNGAPITNYKVQSSNGFNQNCPATTCTLTGLSNNVTYHFTVIATNEVGDSKPSAQSGDVRPDVKPQQMGAPTVKAGDSSMTVNWTPAVSTGSPVKSYTLEVSPAAGGVTQKTGLTGGSYTWKGLTNGTDYTFRIQAVNDAPTPSDWSAYSIADHPAAPPGQPQAPTTRVVSSVGSQNQIAVDWTQPVLNGDPVKNYYVTRSGGGQASVTVTVPGTSQTTNFTVSNSEAAYTFTVQAENKAGKGPVSAASDPRRATGKLGTPQNVTASPTNTGGNGQQITVNFSQLSAAQRNGSGASEVSYRYLASPSGRSGSINPGGTVGGFPNGQAQSITVVADSSVAPSSDASAPAQATPYGSPGTPSASHQDGALNSTSVSFSWNSPSSASNDVADTKISINGGGWQSVPASGSRSYDTGGYGKQATISVQTFNSLGKGGAKASSTATSGAQKTEWPTSLNTGVVTRSCTYTYGGVNWSDATHECDGASNYDAPWFGPGDSFSVKCWVTFENKYWTTSGTVGSKGNFNWYLVTNGSKNGGRYVITGHTKLGEPGGNDVPHC